VTTSRIEREFANLRRRVARLTYSPFGKAVISFRRSLEFQFATFDFVGEVVKFCGKKFRVKRYRVFDISAPLVVNFQQCLYMLS